MVGKIGLSDSIKNYVVGATITALVLLIIMVTVMFILGFIL